MKESYGEGLASHTGPESWGYDGNDVLQALTGERAGWVLSPESSVKQIPGADALLASGRQHWAYRKCKACPNPAGSETPSMHGSSPRGTRESPRSLTADRAVGRTENPEGARL